MNAVMVVGVVFHAVWRMDGCKTLFVFQAGILVAFYCVVPPLVNLTTTLLHALWHSLRWVQS